MKTLIAASLAAFALASGVSAQTPAKRPPTAADLADVRTVADPQVSPDGRWVAFTVTEAGDQKFPKAKRAANLWLVEAGGGTPRRFTPVEPPPPATGPVTGSPTEPTAPKDLSETSPRWMPDGSGLAFLSRRVLTGESDKDAKPQLWFRSTDGARAERLAKLPDGVSRFAFSPDGAMVAIAGREADTPEEAKAKTNGYDQIVVGQNKLTRLWVMSLKDRKLTQVATGEVEVDSFAWSPDGSRFVLAVSPSPHPDDQLQKGEIRIVERATGRIVRKLDIKPGAGLSSNLAWSPDGKFILAGLPHARQIAGWQALYPVEGGAPRVILKDYKGTIETAQFTPDGRQLLVKMLEGSKGRLYLMDVETQALKRVADPAKRPGLLAGSSVAYVADDYDNPGEVWIARLDGSAQPRKLTRLNPQLEAIAFAKEEEISWKSAKDGLTLTGLLFTPPDYQPGRAYPTILEPHGGPTAAWAYGWQASWHDWAQYLATHGYVVLMPNPRGSTGQGPEFANANYRQWGRADLRDDLDGLDMLIRRKIADPNRLGIGGWSYGGYTTMWAVTQTNRFKAAVAGAGISNLISMHGTDDTVAPIEFAFGGTPFNQWDIYTDFSPVRHLAKVKTPVLVVHGQADTQVMTEQGLEYYHGLKTLGADTKLILYPREPHAFTERSHQIHLTEAILEWFDARVKK